MKTPRLHYFKKNTIELPEGYRKPVKRRRKTAVEPPPIVVAKPVIRRRTPRGRLMPLRMKNEFIPPGVDWCQINGQKVRQDIYFGDVRGRMFIPGRLTGEGCEGACTPSMVDFGGGCGCEGCDSGCNGGGGEGSCAVDGCAGCASCADSGCETAGCAETGCTTTSDTGCETSGCAETGCTTTSDTGCTDSGCAQAACAETGCTTTSDTGCSVSCADSGCASCADSGCSSCGGCEGCISCADTGCTSCADTGCSMAPTAGVDFTGSGMGFGYGPSADTGNLGFGNAMGPPGWATGDFGAYGSGGPTSTGFGPGAQGASIGGPGVYAAAPGINGFPGDFGAPPGGTFGTPNDVGMTLAADDFGTPTPGLIGAPNVQQGEALNPSLFGPEVAPATPTVDPNDRSEVDPTTVFGPAFATNQAAPTAGWFGPSQAQAASRSTDQDIINATNQISNEQNMFANDFGRTGADMTAYMAATNPGLAQALNNAAMQMSAAPLVGPGQIGADLTNSSLYGGATPGAQQGFQTGGGPFGGTQGAFSGQPSLGNEQAQGKGDSLNPSGREADSRMNNADILATVDPMVTQHGYQQLAAEMTAQQPQTQTPTVQQSGVPAVDPATAQQGYQMLAAEMNARQNQQDMMTAQEQGEQGKAGREDTFDSRFGTFPMTADAFDAQSRGEQGKGDQLAPWAQTETIGLRPGEDVISSLNPATWGVGREAAPIGLWGMSQDTGRPGGSPPGLPGGGPFGPPGGRPGGETSGRPGLSITVGNNQYAAGRPGGGQQGGGRPGGPGYYQTGGAGIAPGARGAEVGGMYGPGVATGRAGSNTFGVSSREGAYGFYDPVTGQYFVR